MAGVPSADVIFIAEAAEMRLPPIGTVILQEELGYSEIDWNSLLETALVTGLNEVPVVGNLLSGLVGVFWPDDKDDPKVVWQQIKDDVAQLCHDLIDEQRAQGLLDEILGIGNVIDRYLEAQGDQKGQFFTVLLGLLEEQEPNFFHQTAPQLTLTYLVAMGTLKLTALRDQAQFFETIYGYEDPNKALHEQMVEDTINKYITAVLVSRDTAFSWRVSKIVANKDDSSWFGEHYWYVTDVLTGFYQKIPYSRRTGDSEAKRDAEGLREFIRTQEGHKFLANLDYTLKASKLWPYFNPRNPNKPDKLAVFATSGPYGGSNIATSFRDDPRGLPISKIVLHAGDRVDGLEIFYGDVSGGLHGGRGGTRHELVLEAGETIVSAHGRGGGTIDALHFRTSSGREFGAGGGGGTPFEAAPPTEVDAALYAIAGRQGSKSLERIQFEWCYYVPG
ncbi:jacalin-like lectin [Novosphingobium soli]|uniref:Jacalin-like lectin n=2 Tax=Novosphingobium soli TaxID=574956 RepID=A0ABV6CUN1_9SPHN